MSVAVVITDAGEARPLVGWGMRCARARGEDVVVLVPSGKDAGADAEPLPTIRAAVSDVVDTHARMTAVLGEADAPDGAPKAAERCPQFEVVPVRGEDTAAALLAQLNERGGKLLVLAKQTKTRSGEDSLQTTLFREAHCMVVLLRLGAESAGVHCARVLVPTSGGPHATEALKLANQLTRLPDPGCPIDHRGPTGVDALFVEPDVGPEAESVGRRLLDKAVKRAVGELPDHRHVRPIVELGKDFRDGIARVVEGRGYDLVLIGAANQWHARRALFSVVPNKLLTAEDSTLTLGVVRQPTPLMTATAEKVRRVLSRGIPQLEREDRITLVERVQSASEWNVDFIALIMLSTTIATLGLMQDSAAVVIGAMLVAPLMTPLIGCGLAVVQGNGLLLRGAIKSVLLGFLLAMLIALLMGALVPHAGMTHEMLARGKPNALDLAVALISGVAAAYATARPNLLGALPGVAIAAALVPPIATSGVALSHGQYVTSAGAAMLFITNIVAIVLGAAAALFAVGMQARHLHAREKRWTRHALMGLIVGAVILSVPLFYLLYHSLPRGELAADLKDTIAERVESTPQSRFVSVEVGQDHAGQRVVTVTRQAEHAVADDAELAQALDQLIESRTGRPARVHVVTLLMHRSE